MVILEAESFGLPIISFNCKTGPKEMIDDNINGYLVECGNINELSEKMLSFVSNCNIAKKFSMASTNRVKELSIKKIGDEWEKMLKE